MATYYKYAERNAESQVNWAEIGKNMTDMLQEENRLREEKKAAIDEASRKYGEILANPPQGENVSANQFALNLADNASKFMLMEDRLLKSGQRNIKDYTISRQNVMDGTKNIFNISKKFQEQYKIKMERYRTDKSQAIEQFLMANAEGFSNFDKSEAYINPTNGAISIANRKMEVIDGKKVYTMNDNPNEFKSVNSLLADISANYDKYDTAAVTDAFAKSLGKQKDAEFIFGTLSQGGVITSVEDITKRTYLGPDGQKVLFKFIDAENQMINGALANPYNRLSVLTNSKKFADNGKEYGFTYNAEDAKKNPELILLKTNPQTGQSEPDFSEEQMKASQDFMRNEARAKYDFEKKFDATPQAQLQERRAPTAPEIEKGASDQEKMAAAGYWNTIYTGKTLADKQAAADILLRTPIAFKNGLTGIDIGTDNTILLTYMDPSQNNTIKFTDNNNNPIPIDQFSALGVELHGVVDRNKSVRAGGGGGAFVPITGNISAKRQGKSAAVKPITIPLAAITEPSQNAVTSLQSSLPEGFTAKDLSNPYVPGSNNLQITAPNGKIYNYSSKKGVTTATAVKADIEEFIRDNQNTKPQPNPAPNAKTKPKPKPTTTTQGNVR
jgi:hypothetical protein